ncbi:MAG TPA: YARHG domain-containing protein [Puia sp.]|nr:YARHG domain-containing protein [Puia sp.]
MEKNLTTETSGNSFWDSTLGVVTKVTAFLTAVTGLIVAVKAIVPKPSPPPAPPIVSRICDVCGRYPVAWQRNLTNDDLKKLSAEERKIMRNEIFARYGYIFTKSEDMKEYFSKQVWYKPINSNVDNSLSPIEKSNAELILSYEKDHDK